MTLPELLLSPSERAELHIHSHFSDGQYPPETLAQKAAQEGLSVIALTDHATVEGIAEMTLQAARLGIYNIPAIEINAQTGDFLGYYIDYEHKGLLAFLAEVNALRIKRVQRTVARLNELGVAMDWYALVDFALPAIPSRAHIARMLVDFGRYPNVDAVFNTLLGRGKQAYISPEAPSDEICIQMIRKAGGVAVLAHPQYLDLPPAEISSYCHGLTSWGLVGYERLPERTIDPVVFSAWEKAGRDYELLKLSGSGFHGEALSDVKFGTQTVGCDLFPKMEARLPIEAVQKSFFKRMQWRSVNLSLEEFEQSLCPEEIHLKAQTRSYLLDFQPLLKPVPADFSGLPFVLIGPGAFDSHTQIKAILADFGCTIISEEIRCGYPELAWTVYRMYQLSRPAQQQDLLRFELDHHLYGNLADKYRLVFFQNPSRVNLRRIKQHIRSELGQMRFYRVNLQEITDTFFTAYIHIPDEKDIRWECWVLENFGTAASLTAPL